MLGRCSCGDTRYRLTEPPLFVHACHCTWCQRETGTAFALNAMIESDRVVILQGQPELIMTPSNSGKGQEIARCPRCRVAIFSHYAGAGRSVAFVRVGTLEMPAACPPDIHIFTATKLWWLTLDDRVPVVPEYYDRKRYWPQTSLARYETLRAQGENR